MAPLLSSFQDSFPGVSLNVSNWTDVSFNGAVLTVNNKLICTPKVSTSNTGAEADSVNIYDLTGNYGVVNVGTIVGLGGATFFYLFADASNKLFFQCDQTPKVLQAFKVVTGVQTSLGTKAYNATTMAWWRIRERSGTTFWEYSSDGVGFTTLVQATNPITVTSLKVGLEGYDFTAETGQGAANFLNFNIPPNATGWKTLLGVGQI